MIGRYTDMEAKKALARDIAGVGAPPAKAEGVGEKSMAGKKAPGKDKTASP
jgi:hypothetical protein